MHQQSFFSYLYSLKEKQLSIVGGWFGFFTCNSCLCLKQIIFNIFSIRKLSNFAVFLFLLQHSWLVIPAILWAVFSFYNNCLLLTKSLYLEDDTRSSKANRISNYSWLQRFGIIGDLVAIEFKMMLRNKRPRYILMLSGFFILYGFIMYKPETINANNKFGLILFGAIFITGIFYS